MARKKIRTARLPTEGQRKITYGKRRKGILKKAFEISTLCDIQSVLIMFSPSGKLDHFSSKPGIWDILKRFIYTDHITSEIDSESQEASKDVMDSIDYFAAQYDAAHSSGEMVHDEIEVMLLELQKKMMHPESEAFDSTQEFENLIHGLENVRRTIANHSIIANRRNAGRQTLMEQPQAKIKDGMWGPLQGGERMHQEAVRMFGLSTASKMQQHGTDNSGVVQRIHGDTSSSLWGVDTKMSFDDISNNLEQHDTAPQDPEELIKLEQEYQECLQQDPGTFRCLPQCLQDICNKMDQDDTAPQDPEKLSKLEQGLQDCIYAGP